MSAPRKPATNPADAVVELISQSYRLNSRLQARADRMARDVGLTGTRWQVLNAIDQATRPATVSDIARWMGLARQSVQQVANALADDGLIDYQDNPKHQRAPLLGLTAKAEHTLKQLNERRFEWAREVAATLPVDEIEIANQVLNAVRETLSD